MPILLKPLTDSSGFTHGVVIANDRTAGYLWAPGVEPWFDTHSRVRSIGGSKDTRSPKTAKEWLTNALFGIADEYLANSEVTTHTTKAEADAYAEVLFGENTARSVTPQMSAAIDDFIDADGDLDDPAATLALVTSMLGPIDPDGPNGWLLKAAAGEPYDEDDAWIRWTNEGASNAPAEA